MIETLPLAIGPQNFLRTEGWQWLLGEDTLPYVSHEILPIKEQEATAMANAANELYDMYVAAAQYVIDHKLYSDLSIPQGLISAIEFSWEADQYWHLYGRFDLAGGLQGLPLKLLEFNADTATCIPETAIVQWASLMANGKNESAQFNSIFEGLVAQFERLKTNNPTKEPAILFTTMRGTAEDFGNVTVLKEAATQAGFQTEFEYIDDVEFSNEEGIFKYNPNGTFTRYDFWFKLIPWEFLAWDEPDLCDILCHLIVKNKTIVINPPYTLLFQSKGILKTLWQLYPNHALLLETHFEPLQNTKQVQKVVLGREGANLRILDENYNTEAKTDGEYESQATVYQAYTPLNKDKQGNHYQAGVFFAGEACGLGFRRGGAIIDNTAQFVGHMVV